MPANADFLFRILVQIATLNIIPTDSATETIESIIGITNDEFVLTESFVDFEFYSTGPIRNLQIMFLAMLFLFFFPILLLIIRLIFFWSKKVTECVSTINQKLFFNIYIRFGLEAYLELCLSSMIRFKRYSFEDSNEIFHSIFATVLFIGIIAYFLYSIIFLQYRFSSLKSQ